MPLPHIGFATALNQNPELGIAKLHAFQILWRRLQEECGAASPFPAVIHVEKSMRMLTQRDVMTNIIRITAASFTAISGGAVFLSVLPYSAPLGLPDTAEWRNARNCQLVFALENEAVPVQLQYRMQAGQTRLSRLPGMSISVSKRREGFAMLD